MGFSNKIISLRNSNHITQSELAKLLNVTRQSISKWESNQSLPEISKIIEICNVFNCSLEYLLKDGELKKIEGLSYECIPLKEFGKMLALHRKENNLTQELLADKLEVSRQSIYKWESGMAYPEIEKIIQLSKLYNCSIDELVRKENVVIKKIDVQDKTSNQNINAVLEHNNKSIIGCISIIFCLLVMVGVNVLDFFEMYKVIDIVFLSAFSLLVIKFIISLICLILRKRYRLVFNEIFSFAFVFIILSIYFSWLGKDNTIFGKWVAIIQGAIGYVIADYALNNFIQKQPNKRLAVVLISLFILTSATPFFIEHTSFSGDRPLDNIAAKILPTIAMIYMCVLLIVYFVKNRRITIVLVGVAISLLLRFLVTKFELWWLGNVSNTYLMDLDFIKCIFLVMLLIVTILCNFIIKNAKVKNSTNTILACLLFVLLLLPMLNDYLKCMGNPNMFGEYTALFQINLNLVTIILFIILINSRRKAYGKEKI